MFFLKRNKTKQNDYKNEKKGSPGRSLTRGLRRVMETRYQSVQFLLFPSFWAYFYFPLFLHYKKLPFFLFLAGEAKICNKIENGIIVVCVLEWDL